jgi:glycogen synthase
MRALTVGNMYPPQHLGGYELVWQEAVRYLRGRGHEVRVLTSDFRRDGVVESEPEEDLHRELRWYWSDHGWPAIPIRERLRLERHNADALERHLSDFQPEVVGWWSMGGMSQSLIERVRRLQIPAAGFVCEGWMDYGPRVDGWIRATRWPLVGPIAERATGIPTRVRYDEAGPWLFPSELLRRRSSELRGLTRTSVAHQGVDPEVFRPAERPEWDYRLLYVGRIDPRKGIDLAIEALAGLPPAARLTVVGDGDRDHLAELRELARREEVADRVTFLPAESRKRLRDRYAEADVLLFPVRWQEPWGLVPLEAMAVGTPVVATGRGGSGEYLRDRENCLLFDPESGPEALADAVLELGRNADLCRRLHEGGRATAAGIGPDTFSIAVEQVLEDAVAEGR